LPTLQDDRPTSLLWPTTDSIQLLQINDITERGIQTQT